MPHSRYTTHRGDRCQPAGRSGPEVPPPPPAEPEEPPPPPDTCVAFAPGECDPPPPPGHCSAHGLDLAEALACFTAHCWSVVACDWAATFLNITTGEYWYSYIEDIGDCDNPTPWAYQGFFPPDWSCEDWPWDQPPCNC